MRNRMTYRSCGSVLLACMALGAGAQVEPEQIASHQDWDAYVHEGEEGKICYIASAPLESQPSVEQRDGTWVLVTHRPAVSIENEVGVIAGYDYGVGTEVTAIVDAERYALFTQGDGAWLGTPEEEARMVRAMKAGKRLTVVGRSSGGITTTDEYSLFGFTAAHREISRACDVE